MITAIVLSASLAKFAKELMVARQAGVSLARALTVARHNATMQALIVSAYRKPRYSTEQYRERAAVEFANETLITCLDAGEEE
ncbi:MAG: hypothetical protein ACRCXB_26365 [Aeromonadaceae bacterium]